MGAANLWKIAFPSNADWIVLDTDIAFAILSYKIIGLILFFISSFFSLYPMLKITIEKNM